MEPGLTNNEANAIKKLFVISVGKEINAEIEDNRIKLMIDGITIEGVITLRRANEISVSIEKPYKGVVKSSGSIPLIATKFFNYRGDSGTKKAMALLYAIYRFCAWAENRIDELENALNRYELRIEYETFFEPTRQLNMERIVALLDKKQILRKRLKTGEIDNLDYQRQVKTINIEMKSICTEIEIDTNEIFHECFWGYRNTPLELVDKGRAVAYLRSVIDNQTEC